MKRGRGSSLIGRSRCAGSVYAAARPGGRARRAGRRTPPAPRAARGWSGWPGRAAVAGAGSQPGLLDGGAGVRAQPHRHLVEVVAHGGGQDGCPLGDALPVRVATSTAPVVAGGELLEAPEVEQHCLHPEHRCGQVPQTAAVEAPGGTAELSQRVLDLAARDTAGGGGAQGSDLQQRAPLPAHDHRGIAQPLPGEGELGGQAAGAAGRRWSRDDRGRRAGSPRWAPLGR